MMCIIFLSICFLAAREVACEGHAAHDVDEIAMLQVKPPPLQAAAPSQATATASVAAPAQAQRLSQQRGKVTRRVHRNATHCPGSTTCQISGDWSNRSAAVSNMAQKLCNLHNLEHSHPSRLSTWIDIDRNLYNKAVHNSLGYIEPVSVILFLEFKSGAMPVCSDVSASLGGGRVGLRTFPQLLRQSHQEFNGAYPNYLEVANALHHQDLGCACS
eukprot:gnl/TRDRNA2_/TRDRNA2_191169_c0_seq1.p1 gnl/TRDRNA2_/TRDRNA2_191169_c0~~gnl/TRDRNA2_/TRDRNA2_191169_c0_seq1.p1  ORF type:complete len:215 (-),score=18.22 gnl/TRDRNA2_/TRDRNA2_191169_c0_seq1:118-762(-)